MSRAELRKQWQERIAEFRASGQSASAWCAAHGVPQHQLHYWLRKFPDRRQAELTAPIRWLSVQVDENTGNAAPVVIRIGNAAVEVSPGFDPEMLRQIIKVLSTSC